MPESEFKPKISSTRARSVDKDGRLARIVVKAASRNRAPKSPWANALTRRPVIQLARGKGALYGLTPAPAGWRRVIVKARIARHGTSDLGAARAHLRYIQRDGVTRAGGTGHLFDLEHDEADGGGFLERQKGDTYQFRFIVAPEDGAFGFSTCGSSVLGSAVLPSNTDTDTETDNRARRSSGHS